MVPESHKLIDNLNYRFIDLKAKSSWSYQPTSPSYGAPPCTKPNVSCSVLYVHQVWWAPPLHEQPTTVLLQSSPRATWGSLGWLLGSWIWWLISGEKGLIFDFTSLKFLHIFFAAIFVLAVGFRLCSQRPRYAGGGSLWVASFWYCKQGGFWRIRAAAEQCSGIPFRRSHLERALCWHLWCGTVTMMAYVLWTGKWWVFCRLGSSFWSKFGQL